LLGGVQANRDTFPVLSGAAFAREGRLRFRDDDGEGRAQFVRGVGSELRLLSEGGFEPSEG